MREKGKERGRDKGEGIREKGEREGEEGRGRSLMLRTNFKPSSRAYVVNTQVLNQIMVNSVILIAA